MKYAIQCSVYFYNEEKDEEYTEWKYVSVKGAHKIFVFEDSVTKDTKLFNTAKEAGEYLDKHFGKDSLRCSYQNARIVEVEA